MDKLWKSIQNKHFVVSQVWADAFSIMVVNKLKHHGRLQVFSLVFISSW